jgi:hypothetical protein
MAIPSFDKHGFFPAGVHHCTIEEIGRLQGEISKYIAHLEKAAA